MTADAPGLLARYKLRAVAALVALYVTTALGWAWPWGLLFLATTGATLRLGETTLIDDVSRRDNPAVFWAITVTWVSMSLALIAYDLVRWTAPDLLETWMQGAAG